MDLGPLDLPGPQFLWLYGVLAAPALAASVAIPPWLRPEGRLARAADVNELALLAGGADRFAEAVTVRLMGRGAVTADRNRGLTIRDPAAGQTLAERRLLSLASPAPWRQVRQALDDEAERIGARLAARGLLLDASTRAQLRACQSAPLALLALFGMAKWTVGTLRDRPVAILTVLVILTLIAALLRYTLLDPRTRAGQQVLAQARSDHGRLRRAATTDEAPMAVALFGTTVLAGSFLSDFHHMRSAGSGGDSGSSSSDSGGCGGGGCGGCGS